MAARVGEKAKQFVRETFLILIARHLREYLTLMLALLFGDTGDRAEML